MHGAMPIMQPSAKSASSKTMVADLPPSSRKRRFIVAAPFSMIRLPTTVEPVKEIRSTFGDSVSSSPTKWSEAVTTFTTPAGMSVFSAINLPSRVALNGVFGAGFNTTVLPVPSAWPSFWMVTSNGKFHGTIAPTTPAGSRHTFRVVFMPVIEIDRVAERCLPRVFVDQLGRDISARRPAGRRAAARG